jgi:ABC-type nitrate/sulfonate/bicarbonate transport system substrate-binding protein/outer membrane protein OmpA-like peptidoglycan-associated protein
MHSSFAPRLLAAAALVVGLFASVPAQAQPAAEKGKAEFLKAQPLVDGLKSVELKPIKAGALRIPTITWPGDVATIATEQDGTFKEEGLEVELFCENDFAKQVQGVINGETPFLRGTLGMINSSAEAFKKAGTDLVVIYQLTWSTGGDCVVVRPSVKNLTDLKGKTGVIQLYGPHMDFLTTVLSRAGLKPTDVNLKWTKELTLPTYDTKGALVDPRSVFAASPNIDFCTVISPDAAALTSGGKGGTGAESAKGAKTLFDSKVANRVIADTYAVRGDWFDAHQAEVQKFAHALLKGQEQFADLRAKKSENQATYRQLISRSADLLFGSPQATKDVEDSLGDCEWVGFTGNVAFFQGVNTTRSFDALNDEIQTAFIELGLMSGKVKIRQASWDYTSLAKGLSKADISGVKAASSFDPKATQQAVEAEIATELEKYDASGLYRFEVYFAPRQATFSAANYRDAFQKALDWSQTLGGAIVTVEGHNAPDALNKARDEGKSPTEIGQIELAAKNLSYQRALAVRKAYLEFCQAKGLTVDESQFVAVGMGVKSPKFAVPATEEQWNQNRRVVFRIKAVDTELDTFKPAGK